MYRFTRPITGLLGAIVLLSAACGNVAETVAEQIAEEAAGGDVEIDINDDGGNVSIESDEGTMEIGSELDLPDALSIEVPDGGSVTTVLDFDTDVSVVVSYDLGEFDNLIDFYTNWAAGQSEEFQSSINEFDSSDGVSFKTAVWLSNDSATTINLTSCYLAGSTEDEPDAVCLTVSEPK
jgi:hypothetical protein